MMSEDKGKTTLMILLTALGSLAIIILFGWIAFFNPMGGQSEKPSLNLSSLGTEKSKDDLLPEKSAEELLLDNLQKGDDVPLIIEEEPPEIVITMEDDDASEEKTPEIDRDETPKIDADTEVKKVEMSFKEITQDVYWLQVGSFPNSINADKLRNQLKEKGIESVVQTKNINDTLYYRVRIGAFQDKNEARAFEEKILSLDEIDEVTLFVGQVKKQVPPN